MIKKLLFSCLTLLISVQIYAQTPISYSEFLGLQGESFVVHRGDIVDPGSSGLNQTWDFSSLTSNFNYDLEFVAWGGSPYAGNFITANYAILTNDGPEDVYTYYLDQNDESGIVGIGSVSSIISYDNTEKLWEFPITYDDQFSDASSSTFTLDGIDWSESSVSTGHVDGYGTLLLPDISISDVYRIKRTLTQSFASDEGTDYQITSTTHAYFKADIHSFLASSYVWESGEESGGYTDYLNLGNVGVSELSVNNTDLIIYPNPITYSATIELTGLTHQNATLEMFDYTGRKVADFDDIQRSFDNRLTLDFSSCQNGMYIIKYTSKYGTRSKRVVVER